MAKGAWLMKEALDKAGPDEATGEKLPSRAGDWLQLRGFTKWIALAAIIGVLGGAAASAFTEVVDATAASVSVYSNAISSLIALK